MHASYAKRSTRKGPFRVLNKVLLLVLVASRNKEAQTEHQHNEHNKTMLLPQQYYALIILSVVSATLSVVCSGTIVLASCKDKTKSLYQTLIFALSLADLIGSFTTIFHPFMLPRRTREEGLLWASGNDATCSVAGFFFVSCYPLVSFFSMYLSAYFLAKVRYNAQDGVLAKKYLLPGVIVAIVLCGGLAVVGGATDSFAPRVYHNVCYFGDCEMGKDCTETFESGMSWYLGWVQVVLLVLPALISLGLTVCVYMTVRAKLIKTRKFVFGSQDQQRSNQQEKLVAVRNQALLYSLAYWNSFFWYFVYGVIGGDDTVMVEKESDPFYYTISVLVWLLFPLQGVVNFMVYTRPRYLQWRKANMSACMALQKAISIEPVGTLQHLRSTALTEAPSRSYHFPGKTAIRNSMARAFGRLSDETCTGPTTFQEDRTDPTEDPTQTNREDGTTVNAVWADEST